MEYGLATADFSLSPDPETRPPELRLIPGAGEPAPVDAAASRPDLYVVPDDVFEPAGVPSETDATAPADETVTETAAAAEALEIFTAAGMGRLSERRGRAADEAGRRAVTVIRRAEDAPETTGWGSYGEKRRRGGSGSWMMEEHKRQKEREARVIAELEAEGHKRDCDCQICDPDSTLVA